MKKLLALLTVTTLAICLFAGCSGAIPTYTDENKSITTKVNKEFIIALESNPTTGYNWIETHDGNMLTLVEDKYKGKTPALVGSGGTQYYRFKALKAGQAKITATYKRPWEVQIGQQKIFNVTIN